MQVESKRRNKKLDGISHGKTVRRTTPLKASQPSNAAKVRKDIEPTKEKLRNLADRWKGVNKVRGFLTELWKALGIDMTNNSQQNGGNPSRYAAFQLQDGTTLTVTIRASAHNANASTYIKDGNINGDTNISIVLQNRRKKNTFVPHDDVQLSEYVYVEDRIATVDSPLSQIAMSLVGYLTNGKYVDTTGVAIPHTSPQTNDNNILNCNLNMNKKVIRLTESDLHKIVKESINKIMNEIGDTEKGQDALGQVHGRAIKRQQMLGDKGAISRKLHNTARAAMEKAYTQGKKHGFDIYDPNGSFDKGVSKGFEKAKTNESRINRVMKQSVNKVLRESLEGTDEIEEAVTNAASVIADAYHAQNGMQDIANDHDDSWYELQESLREAMLNAAMNVLNSAY